MPVVVILEDDAALRETLVETLEDSYTVRSAANAREALELAEHGPIDLILSDVRMEGMDGLECLKELKRRFPHIQSIVMTGFADAEAPPRALEAHVSDYLYKPFTMQQLQQSIERVLHRPRAQGFLSGLLQKITGALARLEKEMQQLEVARDEACRAYYVAVRSRALALAAAFPLWLRYEELAEQLESLREATAEKRERWLHDIEAFRRLVIAAARPAPRGLTPEGFAALFARVAEGQVSSEQLVLAPFVRAAPVAVRTGSEDLEKLYRSLWT